MVLDQSIHRVHKNFQNILVKHVSSPSAHTDVVYWNCAATFFNRVSVQTEPFKIKYYCTIIVTLILPSVLWHCWLGGRKGIRPVKRTEWWGAGMVICVQQGADLHTEQLMPLPLTVSCFSKIQTGFTFMVPAHPGSPGQRAVKMGQRVFNTAQLPLTQRSSFSTSARIWVPWSPISGLLLRVMRRRPCIRSKSGRRYRKLSFHASLCRSIAWCWHYQPQQQL